MQQLPAPPPPPPAAPPAAAAAAAAVTVATKAGSCLSAGQTVAFQMTPPRPAKIAAAAAA
jgi:hypothetical protein